MRTVERLARYRPGGYHPVHLGDTFNGRYLVEHKLGFGLFSTVWLVRDLRSHGPLLALKIRTADAPSGEEKFLQYLNPQTQNPCASPGFHSQPAGPRGSFFPALFDQFTVNGPNGEHQCVVTEVLGPSLSSIIDSMEEKSERFPVGLARKIGLRLVQAVEELHAHGIVHGDLHPGNIVLRNPELETWTVDDFHNCLGEPKKITLEQAGQIEGQPPSIYQPQSPSIHQPQYLVMTPLISAMLACCLRSIDVSIIDFDLALHQDQPGGENLAGDNQIQRIDIFPPPEYSAPEVQLQDSITQASDIWSLGCLLYEMFADYCMFHSFEYNNTLADVTLCFGILPERWWKIWKERSEYFEENGQLKQDAQDKIPPARDLEKRLRKIPWSRFEKGEVKNADSRMMSYEEFLWFRRVMLEIFKLEPDNRMVAADVLTHLPPRWLKE